MGTVNMLVSARRTRSGGSSTPPVLRFTVIPKTPEASRARKGFLSLPPLRRLSEKRRGKLRRVYGLDSVGLRYFNVFGPRQDPGVEVRSHSDIREKLLAKESPVINGDGETTRDFTYVEKRREREHIGRAGRPPAPCPAYIT